MSTSEPVAWRFRFADGTYTAWIEGKPDRDVGPVEFAYAAPPDALREALKADPGILASSLVIAWDRYVRLFGEPPYGTEKQMKALLSLIPAPDTGKETSLLLRDGPIVTTCENCKGAAHEGKPCPTCKYVNSA